MQDQDVIQLDTSERKLLDLSFQTGLSDRRIRHIALDASLASAVVILAGVYGIAVLWLVALSVSILIISGLEKVSYARSASHYRSLVRKLVHRVEHLEGTQPTALGSHPAARLKLAEPRA